MGICASCLGGGRKASLDDESSRLIPEDPNPLNYGAFGDQNPNILQADPQDVQREHDALQKIVAQTSNHLVDIFAMVPQNLQRAPTPTFSGQDARLLQYQDVLAGASSDIEQPELVQDAIAVDGAPDWLSDDDEEDALKGFKVVRGSNGPFLGGFTNVDKRVQ